MVLLNIGKLFLTEINILYAFWLFKLLDLLVYGSIACRVRASLMKLAGFELGLGCIIRPQSVY